MNGFSPPCFFGRKCIRTRRDQCWHFDSILFFEEKNLPHPHHAESQWDVYQPPKKKCKDWKAGFAVCVLWSSSFFSKKIDSPALKSRMTQAAVHRQIADLSALLPNLLLPKMCLSTHDLPRRASF